MIDDVNQIHHDEWAEHVEGHVIQYTSEYDQHLWDIAGSEFYAEWCLGGGGGLRMLE